MAQSEQSAIDPLRCKQCKRPVEPSDQFCMHCGTQLVDVVRRCSRCNAYPDFTDRFCILCGEALAPNPEKVPTSKNT